MNYHLEQLVVPKVTNRGLLWVGVTPARFPSPAPALPRGPPTLCPHTAGPQTSPSSELSTVIFCERFSPPPMSYSLVLFTSMYVQLVTK